MQSPTNPTQEDNTFHLSVDEIKTRGLEIWNRIPIFIRGVCSLTLFFYLLSFITYYLSFCFSNIPYYTVLYFQIWRLITSVYISTSFLNIFLGFISWIKDASMLEMSMGTVRYFLVFTMNSVLIQVVYSLLMCLLAIVSWKKDLLLIGTKDIARSKEVSNNGLWSLIMCEMTLLCMSNPDSPMKILFLSCDLKAKYYPILLFLLFSLVNGFSLDLQVISGILYGLLYHYLLKKKLQVPYWLVKRLEDSFVFNYLKDFYGFISSTQAGQISDVKIFSTDNTMQNNNVNRDSNANIIFAQNTTSTPNAINYNNGIDYNDVGQSSNDSRNMSNSNPSTNITLDLKEDIPENKAS